MGNGHASLLLLWKRKNDLHRISVLPHPVDFQYRHHTISSSNHLFNNWKETFRASSQFVKKYYLHPRDLPHNKNKSRVADLVERKLRSREHNSFKTIITQRTEVCLGNGFKHGLIIKDIAAVHRVPQPDPANTNFISVSHLINSHKFMASWLYRELGFSSNKNWDLGGFSI